MTAPSWERSACANADPERWFPPPNTPHRQVAAAVAVCAGCPVRLECLLFALSHDERYGIWGGFTAEERRSLAKPHGARYDGRREGAA